MVTLVPLSAEAHPLRHRMELGLRIGDHVAPQALTVDGRMLADRIYVNGHGLPDSREAFVGVEILVPRDDRNIFDESLSDEETVERVVVMGRQFRNRMKVLKVDCQEAETVEFQLMRNKFVQGILDRKAAKPGFDVHLPGACDTNPLLCQWILNGLPCSNG